VNAHATAIVESGAQIDRSVKIGAYCFVSKNSVLGPGVHLRANVVIEGKVEVGRATEIGVGSVIQGPAVIGSNTTVFPYVIIGQAGQYPGNHNANGTVEIGNEVTLREFVVVNKSVSTLSTKIGHRCYIMARTQVDHDCVLEPFVKTATGVTLGGSVHIEEHAYLGMNAVVHQGMRIGRACMIAMNGVVKAHVPPFTTLINQRINRINAIGLRRLGASEEDIASIEAFYRGQKDNLRAGKAKDIWLEHIDSFIAQVYPERIAKFL
jgi:UDP-N-acetylglucosamine acyltransferase